MCECSWHTYATLFVDRAPVEVEPLDSEFHPGSATEDDDKNKEEPEETDMTSKGKPKNKCMGGNRLDITSARQTPALTRNAPLPLPKPKPVK